MPRPACNVIRERQERIKVVRKRSITSADIDGYSLNEDF